MSAEPNRKKSRGVIELTVLRTEWRTPEMVRLVLGGQGIATFTANSFTDQYVKLIFPPPGVTYPEPFDMERIQAELPKDQWPVRRTYTVRAFDPDLAELIIDVVCHGDSGIAGPWAAKAQPGDVVRLVGPGGAYAPSVEADWHFMTGDESAIPAIAASLERIDVDTPVRVILQVDNPDEEQKLECPGNADITWLFRNEATTANPRDEWFAAVSDCEFPAGTGQFFVHGEAETVMKRIRPLLLKERGVDRSQLSISGYWRCGDNDEAFRAWKAREKAHATNGG
ncbi:NADPH-dependent ferric siderophore reductase [Stackebrandtia endophytica]|uniref:NADPH-dependent ferric siderophore reductase n=1 Tax=Stackebrandtia endophytica TaxID=1496996 RepID=A0A543B1X7_9ACTN|nr:siderophore-interacting protein [Stackebrandtia endophytica]TQL78848.1 NADPH-dependent ferric siderophore reductase [Stackebrandtia endophytica]